MIQITAGLGLLLALSLGTNGMFYKLHKQDLIEISFLRASVLDLQEEVKTRTDALQNAQKAIQGNQEALRELELIYQQSLTQLQGYKKRQRTALKKPKLVERLANKATANIFDELHKVTGGR